MSSIALGSPATQSSLYCYEDLRIVHLELTHRCNAVCPMRIAGDTHFVKSQKCVSTFISHTAGFLFSDKTIFAVASAPNARRIERAA